MSKQTTKKNTPAAKIGKGMTRRERWREHARAFIESKRGNECFVPVEWLEAAEGRPLHEAIVDRLVALRGWGATNPMHDQKIHLETDAEYEAAGTRTRNAHEASVVHVECSSMLTPYPNMIDRADLHEVIERFYHAGDGCLDAAIKRAVKCALAWEREAERNADKIDAPSGGAI